MVSMTGYMHRIQAFRRSFSFTLVPILMTILVILTSAFGPSQDKFRKHHTKEQSAACQRSFQNGLTLKSRMGVAAYQRPSLTPLRKRTKNIYPMSNELREIYDNVWKRSYSNKSIACWSCRFGSEVANRLGVNTVLDAGAGNGGLIRLLRQEGFSAYGVELSQKEVEEDALDLLSKGWIEVGSLADISFENDQFDLVISGDVLEHVLPTQIDTVVSEIVRVSKRHIFLSISQKKSKISTSSGRNIHTLLRPRDWWEATFKKHGACVNSNLFSTMQEYLRSPDKNVYDCTTEGDAREGGKFNVCSVYSPWLVGNPDHKFLREERCVTTHNMEMEPWYFSFSKNEDDCFC